MSCRFLGRKRAVLLVRWLSSEAVPVAGGDKLDEYAAMLRECRDSGDYIRGKRVHEKLVHDRLFGRFLGNLLVEMYGKCHRLEDAQEVFDRIRTKNVFTWNVMACAYTQNGQDGDAIQLYRTMCLEGVEVDEFTILAVLSACANSGCLKIGRAVFESIRGSKTLENSLVGSSVISMFGKCGSPEDARSVFDGMANKTRSSWNAMLATFSQNTLSTEAISLFRSMQLEGEKPDSVTFVSTLDACGSLGSLGEAKAVHEISRAGGFDIDCVVGNALISMYGRCKSCSESRDVFNKLLGRNIVSWTAMIAAYGQNGHHREALELFERIDCEPDAVLLVSVLSSCGSLCDLETGRRIHDRHCRGFETTIRVGNALLEFYTRCGAVEEAARAFARISSRDVQSWAMMISALAHSGHGSSAVEKFFEMVVEGVRPNEIIFTNILDTCSHLGLMIQARSFFATMAEDHGIAARVEHFGCLVDLLGRIGEMEEAEEMIELMPLGVDEIIFSSLASACRVHGDVERGAIVASSLMDHTASACYILVSNSLGAD